LSIHLRGYWDAPVIRDYDAHRGSRPDLICREGNADRECYLNPCRKVRGAKNRPTATQNKELTAYSLNSVSKHRVFDFHFTCPPKRFSTDG
jgi:hypothetical protein